MLRNPTCFKCAFLLAAIFLAAGLGARQSTRAAQADLPPGKGVELAREKCIGCHEADLIVSQRLSRAGWGRELDKMIRWGAAVSDAEKETLVEYFATRFAPRPAAPSAPAGAARGKDIFENRCLLCHEIDLTQQQHLSRAGWTREVDKMIRWGAAVSDAEKEPLIDYLSASCGPNRK